MTDTLSQTRTVTVERDLPFPPDRIWRALTRPELIAEWLMKNDFSAETGHSFTLSGDWGSVDCEVLALEPESRLSYSWAGMGLDTVVTWTLSPTSTGTLLRMEQTGFTPDNPRAYGGARQGWPAYFENLERLLARGA